MRSGGFFQIFGTEMKHYFAYLFMLFTSMEVGAQVNINGFVMDAESKEPLVGANIFDLAGQTGAVTNHVGFFSLRIKKVEQLSLSVSYVGYQTHVAALGGLADTLLEIGLVPLFLQEVEVTALKSSPSGSQGDLVYLPVMELERVPQVFGERDIFKALQTLPGVSNSVEGTSGLVVRGGSIDQNLILFDEAVVYNPGHLLGLVSIANSDAIKDIKLYKGGFPARYGGRLSSVLDLTMKEGSKTGASHQFSLGLISSRFSSEGPLRKGKSSYLFSARSSYLGLFLLPQKWQFRNGRAEQYFDYWLYDLNGKVSFDLPGNGKLQVSAYRSFDSYKVEEGTAARTSGGSLRWKNDLLSARYSRPIGNRWFGNFLLSFSSFQLVTGLESPEIEARLLSGVTDMNLKATMHFSPAANFDMILGIQPVLHRFTPVAISSSLLDKETESRIDAFEGAAFVESRFSIRRKLTVNAGFRYAFFAEKDGAYHLPEPRLSARYRLKEGYTVEMAYARMGQFIHLLSNGGSSLPTDIWVPATGSVPPQAGDHFSAVFERSFPNFTLSAGGFYKRTENLVDYSPGQSFLFSYEADWQDLIETEGDGKGYGAEFFVHKNKGKWTGWMAYTLSWTWHRFAAFNDNAWYPFRFDRRHELELTGSYSFGKNNNKQLSIAWIYQSGIAITAPVAYFLNINGELVPLYREKNNSRSPSYHRLDIAYSISKKTRKENLLTWNLGVYNLYNRQNPFFISFKSFAIYEDPQNLLSPIKGQTNFVEKGTFLPVLPYVSFQMNF